MIFSKKKEDYYNFDSATVSGLFNLLNIKKMNNRYVGSVVKSSAEAKERASKNTTESWAKDDGTKKENVRRAAKKTASTILQREDIQKKSKETRKSPQYRELLRTDTQARALAWARHPKIKNEMKKIAKLFPGLSKIISKTEKGKPLTEIEEAVLKTYLKKCERENPNHRKIVGEEYHKILVEWGLQNK